VRRPRQARQRAEGVTVRLLVIGLRHSHGFGRENCGNSTAAAVVAVEAPFTALPGKPGAGASGKTSPLSRPFEGPDAAASSETRRSPDGPSRALTGASGAGEALPPAERAVLPL